MRKIVCFLLASIFFITLLSGCNGSDSEYDEEKNSLAKTIAAEYIDENYKNIKAIEMGDLSEAPMGSITIDGTVNGKAGFSISLDENLNVSSIAEDEGFPEQKKECRKHFCE
ncbi:hypothetical protein CHH49_16620 [Terribacillus saccharophilus]|uniref:hypothetical protein n=1 Tax=Terribacillus saccharophilus TaxID=361277 RepID=UPI000BA59AD0|nr:hypothetical protein [Terribacillus saccharophilus]PAF20400.1 hypothetical protein CHH49_16620 [Terribacillus saccharophilus]